MNEISPPTIPTTSAPFPRGDARCESRCGRPAASAPATLGDVPVAPRALVAPTSRRWTALATGLALVIAGCGDDEARTPPTAPSADPGVTEPATPPAYEVHEWGLIGTDVDSEAAEIAASPGGPGLGNLFGDPGLGTVTGNPGLGLPAPRGLGHTGTGPAGGKPLLYFHRLDPPSEGGGAAPLRVTTTAAIPGGKLLEHWPPGALTQAGSTVQWQATIAHGACPSQRRPEIGQSPCTDVEDHYCEGAELRFYETTDSDCLEVDGQRFNHVFYRARLGQAALPILVTRNEGAGGGFLIENRGHGPLPGKLIRIAGRSDDGAATRVAIFDAPTPGQPVPMTEATATGRTAEAIASLRTGLASLGLSVDEVRVFLDAWQAELFGGPIDPARESLDNGFPPAGLMRAPDALLYLMPEAAVASLATLAFDPAPARVRRAFLVRVAIGDPAPGGTFGMVGDIGSSPLSQFADREYVPPGAVPSAGRPAVTAHVGPISVQGALDRDVARRIIRRHLGAAQRCAAAEGALTANTARVDLVLTVGAAGSVDEATVRSRNGVSDGLVACVTTAARAMRFPASATPAPSTIVQPILFERSTPPSQPGASQGPR